MCNIGVERLMVDFEPVQVEPPVEPAADRPSEQEPAVSIPDPVEVPA
ncbi:MAG: hypothetical protein JWN35_430 [Frankiales bacterium]|jgi:hypothetical protein|nr:hypothetical protein [Frankiales bacterium]